MTIESIEVLDSDGTVEVVSLVVAIDDPDVAGVIASDGQSWSVTPFANIKAIFAFTKADVGLGNADNTADSVKPVSSAQALAISNAAAAASGAAVTTSTAYADALFALRPIKSPARIALTSNVNVASPGALSDGPISLGVGDPVLLMGQTNGAQNGPYLFNGPASPLTRTTDTNTSAKMIPGLVMTVTEGSYADKVIELQTDGPIVLDTTALSFGLMTGASSTAPIIAWSGTAYSPRNTVSTSSATPVVWVGPSAPTAGGGYAAGVDIWINTTEVS